MKKALLALGVLVTIGSFQPAQAADWYYVGHDGDDTVFIDNSTVQKTNKEAVVLIKSNNRDGDYELTKMLFNRYGRYTIDLETWEYNRNGQLEEHSYKADKRDNIDANDIEAKVYELIW